MSQVRHRPSRLRRAHPQPQLCELSCYLFRQSSLGLQNRAQLTWYDIHGATTMWITRHQWYPSNASPVPSTSSAAKNNSRLGSIHVVMTFLRQVFSWTVQGLESELSVSRLDETLLAFYEVFFLKIWCLQMKWSILQVDSLMFANRMFDAANWCLLPHVMASM